MASQINTVTGSISPDALGRTLMHEHVLIGYPGWESDTLHPGAGHDEWRRISRDRVEEMRDSGIGAMVDPCPNDLGRDVELMAQVSSDTGFPIIAATGLYKESEGGAAYWKFRSRFPGAPDAMAELFIHELTVGIGDTGIKAGIIKVATGYHGITDYEKVILEAAARASVETGAPITTHTDGGKLGDEQQAILTKNGVPAHKIVIGHSCGTDNHAYHMGIVRNGSYLGFDRFGLEFMQPDDTRVAALAKVIQAGGGAHIVVSHDTVWCWRGQPFPDGAALASDAWTPSHFSKRIIPKLQAAGATDEQIDALLIDNPRRYFAGDPLP